ncbi:MAG TPA: protein kinase [Pyrinomonadaceae bacterium]|nr:protein kinase [Pyrinomonadaceae bacterium]
MITHDRWQRIKEIFQSAQEKTPAERIDFLNEMCGDDSSLREEVEALLTADASNDDDHFLDTPAFELGAGLIVGDTHEPIEFSAGQKVDHYTIVRLLGAGGMGQIYLAEDDHLGRKIALKFIAREFATNPRRVLRFEQEARAVSSLNHPNVCVIHQTGVIENNRHFIAMEYIEGITLRDKLARETLTSLEALHIAMQVAAALASAHAAGIVHRDIKPENIMVRPDGYVKVLDFGLAKLTERVSQPQPASKNVRTEAGTLMGTVKYMSPEQLREFELDERTDVWSLGVVLYEMLTGLTPFESRVPNDSIVMILGPQPVSLPFPDHVPVRLREIVSKALQKDRDTRYETTHKLAADLSALHKELERQSDGDTEAINAPASNLYLPPVKSGKTQQLTAGSAIFQRLKSQALSTSDFLVSEIRTHRTAAALFTGATGVLVLLLLLPSAPRVTNWLLSRSAVEKVFVPKLTFLTNSGTSVVAAYSPDGKFVAYVEEEFGKQRVVVRNAITSDSWTVTPPEEGRYLGLSFSRDNTFLYLTRKETDGRSLLYRLPYPATASVQPLSLQVKADVHSAISLSPKGDQYAFVRTDKNGNGFSVVVADALDGRNERVLSTRGGDGGSTFSTLGLSWAPDGRTIVCPTGYWNDGFHMQLILIDVNTGNERVLGTKDWFFIDQAAWQPDSSGVIICAREAETTPFQLWRVTYPGGVVQKVTNDLNEYRGVSLGGDKIVTVRTERPWQTWITTPGGGQSVQIASGVGFTYGITWPTSDAIIHASKSGDRMDIRLMNPDGGNKTPLTYSGINYTPAGSPDGRYVVFSSDREHEGSFNIWRLDVRSGDLKQLTFTDANYYPSVSPDGKWVAYDNMSNTKMSIWKVPFEGGEPIKIIDGYRMPVFSPDSKLIAARYDEDSGSKDVAIFSADGGEALQRVPVRIIEWQTVRWFDINTLTYIERVNGVSNLWSYDLRTGAKKQLTFFDSDEIVAFAWSPDFKRVACQRVSNIGDVTIISSER